MYNIWMRYIMGEEFLHLPEDSPYTFERVMNTDRDDLPEEVIGLFDQYTDWLLEHHLPPTRKLFNHAIHAEPIKPYHTHQFFPLTPDIVVDYHSMHPDDAMWMINMFLDPFLANVGNPPFTFREREVNSIDLTSDYPLTPPTVAPGPPRMNRGFEGNPNLAGIPHNHIARMAFIVIGSMHPASLMAYEDREGHNYGTVKLLFCNRSRQYALTEEYYHNGCPG